MVKPLITPLSSIRSTRRFTAGADRFTVLPDLGEGGPRMLGQLGEDALIGVVQAVHRCPLSPYTINRRNADSSAINQP